MGNRRNLALLGSIVKIPPQGLSNVEKIVLENLKEMKIEPKDIPLSIALYKEDKYIVYPSDPSKEIKGLGSCSKQSRGFCGGKFEMGVEYFPYAFRKGDKDYHVLILFQNPLGYYLKGLAEKVSWPSFLK